MTWPIQMPRTANGMSPTRIMTVIEIQRSAGSRTPTAAPAV
jgi:hypothetical protein